MTDVRTARPDDCDAAVRLLDAAMLDVDADRIRRRAESGDLLVAEADGRVVGVCVLDRRTEETEVTQIAVHRSRRARGIGRELVESAAASTTKPLVATFRPQVRPFYESLGFEIRPDDGDESRFRGVRTRQPTEDT